MVSKVSYPHTKEFLEESQRFASGIDTHFQDHSTSCSSHSSLSCKGTVHHHYHDSGISSWGWWPLYHRPVNNYYYYNSSPSSSDSYSSSGHEKSKKDYSSLAIPLAIGALAALYPTAQNWGEWSMTEKGIGKLNQKMWMVESELRSDNWRDQPKTSAAKRDLRNALRSVFQQQRTILNMKRTDAKTGFLWKTVLVGSLTLGAAASWASAPLFLGAACVSGVSSVGAMIWRTGTRSMDDEIKEEARDLQKTIQYAERALQRAQYA